MALLTIEVSDSQLYRLEQLAARYKIPLETLVRLGLESLLAVGDDKLDGEIEFILQENDELYRRLA